MDRISRLELYMGMASLNAQRATCERGKVGAILVRDGRVIATGYNGRLEGEKDCSKAICNFDLPCTKSIHAEHNIILFAAKHGIRTEGSVLYCTTKPCENCAKVLIQAGIAEVYYRGEYRDNNGLVLLEKFGIKVENV